MNNTNNILAVIPARWASTRLPGKPLEMLGDKSMIQRVYEQVSSCEDIDKVVVATDDQRLVDHCLALDLEVVLTREDHPSGTDRVAEVAAIYHDFDKIINVQGDEPFINPKQIAELISLMRQDHVSIGTQYVAIANEDKLFDYNVVKLVPNLKSEVLYFSRQAIPAHRDIPYKQWLGETDYYQHVGIYAFERKTLLDIVQLPVSRLEQSEKLEQLRWMENGYRIHAVETQYHSIGIDTPEDLEAARVLIKEANG